MPAGYVYRVALQNESGLRFRSTDRKEITVCSAVSVYDYICELVRKYFSCVYRLGSFLSTLIVKLYHYFFTQTPQKWRHFSYLERRFMFC